MLHKETVEKGTLALIKKLSSDEKLKDFVLVGGTALALQIGHRKSVDIDLFSKQPFDKNAIAEHLKANYATDMVNVERSDYTVHAYISNVRTTLIRHNYPDVNPPLAGCVSNKIPGHEQGACYKRARPS